MTGRTAGSDNPYAQWSPIVTRPPLRWPGGAAVAASVIVSIEHLEWAPPPDAVPPSFAVAYGPYPRAFQLTGVSRPEYGSRVGGFRLLRLLDAHGITPAVAMDAALLSDRRRLVEEFSARGAEFLGHGVALNRTLSERLPEETERAEIADTLSALEAATGRRPSGWLGADYAESTRTVGLLAEAGVDYVCDWPNDEQPYLMDAGGRQLVSVPVTVDLDDVMVQKLRRLGPERWSRMVIESLARLRADGSDGSGRVLILNLHAHVSGQPFRVKYVDRALAALAAADDVWIATPGRIVESYRGQSLASEAR
jgi:allantoinase